MPDAPEARARRVVVDGVETTLGRCFRALVRDKDIVDGSLPSKRVVIGGMM